MSEREDSNGSRAESDSQEKSWLPSVPAPIKRVFDKFPLATYPANKLPSRSSTGANEHRLYIFTDTRSARRSAPSHNPQCLKWQAYLKFSGIPFRTVPSNNHASPSGSLPYLLPATSTDTPTIESLAPIPSRKLQKWTQEQVKMEQEDSPDTRFDVYTSLLDHRIRNAWLYSVYLDELNFDSIVRRLYVNTTSSNSIVRIVIAKSLQDASRNELLKNSPYIDVDDLIAEARHAFEALSVLLGSDTYFFGKAEPGLFDASVFSYTHLILDENLGWKRNPLKKCLNKNESLVQHRNRLLERYF